ncbi:MAG TPA: uracil-DNA glycosylase family protein [bacterium]|nr:uracil-DNA glycosylase family protein [bacterium]
MEYLSCVDQTGMEVSSQPRSECHGNPGHLHRVVHIFIENSAGCLLAQKRSLAKDIQPGRWDTAVGGHVLPGEPIRRAAIRECVEELGVEPRDLTELYRYIWLSDMESEWVTTFRAYHEGPFRWDRNEIDALRFLDNAAFDELKEADALTPNFIHEKNRYDAWRSRSSEKWADYPIYDLVRCRRCPRLVEYRESIRGRGSLAEVNYWNRPVPGFGDPDARILILGLAPGAHGANRTGRPFTGDAAGDVLFRALHTAGLCTQPSGTERGDGLRLKDTFIINAVKCVPPENKPTGLETRTCLEWLDRELAALPRVQMVICLGRLAFDAIKRHFRTKVPDPVLWRSAVFGNGVVFQPGNGLPAIAGLYHPSRRNLNTGLITVDGFVKAFQQLTSFRDDTLERTV